MDTYSIFMTKILQNCVTGTKGSCIFPSHCSGLE